ncbi:MAG: hypothetical protein A2511_02455 [Deltaproteobacteria bacterium RIFOXYD12_FULL_50_9]|nr:MAG: hypothetical protein A2511_02455 [Deltaproteobacteria bacterium RIFOXYD12_FULL_50_9]
MSTDNRKSMASEIKNLFEEAMTLANSQINGKYIFAGFRTTGYNEIEPAPFMADKVDGYRVIGSPPAAINADLTGTVSNTTINAGDLLLNGNAVGAISAVAVTNGLNMDKAANAKAALNAADPTMDATLTTLYAGGAATADAGGGSTISFDLNNVTLTVTIPAGTSATDVSALVAGAVNSVTDQTGVVAVVGDGNNGGAAGADSVVLSNSRAGDEGAITIANLQEPDSARSGLIADTYSIAIDPNSNTGKISLASSASFVLSSPTVVDDSILTELGLAGGTGGFGDEAGDGTLVYGPRLADSDLLLNGLELTGISDDGLSDIYADTSAAAKADAINTLTAATGITAVVEPASLTAVQAVEAGIEKTGLTGVVTNGAIPAGDLSINGISIGAIAGGPANNGLNMLKAANSRAAINAVTVRTEITARLTTLTTGGVAAAGTTTTVSFNLNNVGISFRTNANPLSDAAAAINSVSDQTGVTAALGTGNNGAPVGQLVLTNTLSGDESAIVITNFNGGPGTADTGLSNMNQQPDTTHNTGTITFTAPRSFTLAGPDLHKIGLDGGEDVTGIPGDIANDGNLTYGSTAAYIGTGDLIINGVDIFSKATLAVAKDSTNSLIGAINAKTAETGVKAGCNADGQLILTATDGRNIHIRTSANGERITHLSAGSPVSPQNKVYFGALKLVSDRVFSIATTPTANFEPGLESLGLAGGAAVTDEDSDIAGDGALNVNTIHIQTDGIRYTGDRVNDLSIKVGSRTSLAIGTNGKNAFMDTGVLQSLKTLEQILMGSQFTQTAGNVMIADTQVALGSKASGLERYAELIAGSFTVTITDNDFYPPQTKDITIQFDPEVDTAESITQKFNGVPELSAEWQKNGVLSITTTDPKRYSFVLGNDSSELLNVLNINNEGNQNYGLEKTIASLDEIMGALTTHISDFGAKSNRIQVQSSIYTSLELTNSEYLSEKEDTDIIKALMDLKTKEVAYQAALAASAKTMQLSLVDFLR